MKKILLTTTAAFAVLAGSASGDPHDGGIVLAKDQASGTRAHAQVFVLEVPRSALHRRVEVQAFAKPRQRVTAGWMSVCYVGGSFGRAGKDRTGQAPLSVVIDPPTFPEDNKCRIVADATLSKKGRLTLRVVAR